MASSDKEVHIAFQNFFNMHYKRFVLQAIRIVKVGAKAEDIVQDCFIKLWNKRNDLVFDDSSLGYFHVMVKNKCLDYLRSHKETTSIENESYAIPDKENKIDSIEYKEFSISVNQAIDQLPERCRQVFVLSRFENMSYKEIAEHLEISTKTVENQISKALKQLRSKLLSLFFSILF